MFHRGCLFSSFIFAHVTPLKNLLVYLYVQLLSYPCLVVGIVKVGFDLNNIPNAIQADIAQYKNKNSCTGVGIYRSNVTVTSRGNHQTLPLSPTSSHTSDELSSTCSAGGYLECEPGYFCPGDLKKYKCAAGYWGASRRNTQSKCDGPCPKGYYCPVGSTNPIPCQDKSSYCPLQSSSPTSVPPGYYSKSLQVSTIKGGNGSLSIFYAVSKAEPGYWAIGGEKYPCEAGRYGSISGLSTKTCEGACDGGWWCPAGSTSSRERPCYTESSVSNIHAELIENNNHTAPYTFYCPPSGKRPLKIPKGYYGLKYTDRLQAPDSGYYGIKQCEAGTFCIRGKRLLCPKGRYGAINGLSNSSCSGVCKPGYYCPAGSPQPDQFECGASHLYCPEGSSESLQVPKGYYSHGDGALSPGIRNENGEFRTYVGKENATPNFHPWLSTVRTRSSISLCTIGYFCPGDGERYECPSGRFGNKEGLSDSKCSGPCKEGFWCGKKSTSSTQNKCTVISVDQQTGLNVARASTESRSQAVGNTAASLTDTNGTLTNLLDEADADTVFCPQASMQPQPVKDGYYTVNNVYEMKCEPGFYCVKGRRYKCPSGRYGNIFGLSNSNCTDKCLAGYFCESGSPSSTQYPCGDADHYCPEGSSYPLEVPKGHYTISAHVLVAGKDGDIYQVFGDGINDNYPEYDSLQSSQHVVDVSDSGGLSAQEEQDLAYTQDSFYSIHSNVNQNEFYINNDISGNGGGVGAIGSVGHMRILGHFTTRSSYKIAPIGHYAIEGIRYRCPAGRWGQEEGMSDSTCSGACSPGFYCPPGSTSPKQVACGDANYYCPRGSAFPLQVPTGYYTSLYGGSIYYYSETEDITSASSHNGGLQFKDLHPPAGIFYSQRIGDNTTNNLYYAQRNGLVKHGGHYTPQATHHMPIHEVTQRALEENLYFLYIVAGNDELSTQNNVCPPGFFRNTTWDPSLTHVPNRDPYTDDYDPNAIYDVSAITTRVVKPCQLCPWGTYKAHQGDELSMCLPCPEFQAISSYDRQTCLCYRLAGGNEEYHNLYFNRTSSTCFNVSSTFIPNDEDLGFIPDASDLVRSKIYHCERGFWCVNGIRYPAPAGRYGNELGLTKPTVSGECYQGYFCPDGSQSPRAIPCGSSHFYCPYGSPHPLYVHPGYYTDDEDDSYEEFYNELAMPQPYIFPVGYTAPMRESYSADPETMTTPNPIEEQQQKRIHFEKYGDFNQSSLTQVRRKICPVGYYCPGDGRRLPCPSGRFGEIEGQSSSMCSGLCTPGYYCPLGSYSHTQFKCGGANLYCPKGSSIPTRVDKGFYTIHTAGNDHGSADKARYLDPQNLTMSAQVLTEPGYWSLDGIKYNCPEGTYGFEYGLTDPSCSGLCAPGYRCPSYPSGRGSISAMEYECYDTSAAGSMTGTPLGAGQTADGSTTSHIIAQSGMHTNPEAVFCPRGTGREPKYVRPGYYSRGDNNNAKYNDDHLSNSNTTRSEEALCEEGFYCQRGIKKVCPVGTFGAARGLTDHICSGWCEAGNFCPEQSIVPIPCPLGSYSLQGSEFCVNCATSRRIDLDIENKIIKAYLENYENNRKNEDPLDDVEVPEQALPGFESKLSAQVCKNSRLCCSYFSTVV